MIKTQWNNKQQVLKAVSQSGNSLRFASEELKNDKGVVLAAVTQDGNCLRFASELLKNDKEIVLVAVNQDGYALQYASKKLQNDLELLNLLHQFYNLPKKKIEDVNTDNQKWFEERMKIRDILREQDLMQQSIPENKKPDNLRSLKF